jgi:hypothetical protein
MTPPDTVFQDAGRYELADPQIAQLRVPPHSTEAESSVLGGLLLDNGAWDRMGDLLVDADFYRHEHRLIFAAIASLINASRPADVITVFEHLQSQGHAERPVASATSIRWRSLCQAPATSAAMPRSCASDRCCAS